MAAYSGKLILFHDSPADTTYSDRTFVFGIFFGYGNGFYGRQ